MPKKQRRFEITEDNSLYEGFKTYLVGGYVRLSVDKHDRKTESIENQKDAIELFVKNNNENPARKFNLKIKDFYEDKGLTGTNFERAGFERLLADAKAGTIEAIIVKDFSRFGRDFLEGSNYIENIFPFLGIRFFAIGDHYDSMAHDAESKRFEVRLKNLINDMYAKDGSKKIVDVKRLSQKKGSFVGSKCPYGYRAEWIDDIRTLVPDGETADVVRDIFRIYNSGASITEVIDTLYEKKVLRPGEYIKTGHVRWEEGDKHYRWRRGTVQDILRSMVYAGDLAQGKFEQRLYDGLKDRKTIDKADWIVIEDSHEALVSREEYELASQRVDRELNLDIANGAKRNKSKIRKNAIYENVFGDVIHCGDCGKRLGASYYQGRIKDIRNYRYYCRGQYSYDERQCKNKSITEEKLLVVFQQVIKDTLKASGVKAKDLTNANSKVANGVIDAIKKKQQELAKKKASLEDDVQQAYFDFKKGRISLEEYTVQKNRLPYLEEQYEKQIDELDMKIIHANRDKERQNKFLRSLFKAQTTRKIDRELVNEIVDSIYLFEGERVIINLKFKGGDLYGA